MKINGGRIHEKKRGGRQGGPDIGSIEIGARSGWFPPKPVFERKDRRGWGKGRRDRRDKQD